MSFYTYIWLDINRTPEYVGKGTHKRAFINSSHCIKCPPRDQIIVIPRKSEKSAFAEEIRLISIFGRLDLGTGTLFNRTNGGECPPRQTGHLSTPKQLAAIKRQGRRNAKSGLLNRIRTPESTSKGGKTVTAKKLAHLMRVADKLRGVPRPEAVKQKLLAGLKAAHAARPGKAWRKNVVCK